MAKWLKHLTVDQKVPGLNPTCCFSRKVFSLPLLPWETSLWLKGPGSKIRHLYQPNVPCQRCLHGSASPTIGCRWSSLDCHVKIIFGFTPKSWARRYTGSALAIIVNVYIVYVATLRARSNNANPCTTPHTAISSVVREFTAAQVAAT